MRRPRFKLRNTGGTGAIDEALRGMPGVQRVHVDREHGRVEIEGKALKLPAPAVKLWEIGYPEV